jgi:hypothetical protein
MRTEIELTFSRKDFEEIYFIDNQGNYILSRTTKTAFIILTISTLALISAILYAMIYNIYSFMFLACLFFIIALVNYITAFRILYKWKSQIFTFFNSAEKYKKNKLILSDNSFTLIQDDKETIERWTNFSSVKISNQYINMLGKENCIFPSKSMTIEDYQKLREIVSEKIK